MNAITASSGKFTVTLVPVWLIVQCLKKGLHAGNCLSAQFFINSQ